MPESSIDFVKTCTVCKRVYPATSEFFHAQSKGKYGYTSKCKDCKNKEIESWRMANQDKHRSYKVKWRTENPEKAKEVRRNGERRRRAQKTNTRTDSYTEFDVLELYGTNCHMCGYAIDLTAPRNCVGDGWEFGLQIDHVIQLVLGGTDTLDNVRPSHAICNSRKNKR